MTTNADNAVRPKVVSINLSDKRGMRKKPAAEAVLIADVGIEGDIHAGGGDRQVSFLAEESVARQRDAVAAKNLDFELRPGDYAENITTIGVDLLALPLGTRLRIGAEALLEVSKIGKTCHHHCEIYRQLGECVMPSEGIFCRVITGGVIRAGDPIELLQHGGNA